MSKDDWETRKTLITPHVEIGKGIDPSMIAYVNVDTFKKCSGKLINFLKIPEGSFYSIYGTVGRPVAFLTEEAYLNIDDPPISRTLMGYLEEEVLRNQLPNTYKALNKK